MMPLCFAPLLAGAPVRGFRRLAETAGGEGDGGRRRNRSTGHTPGDRSNRDGGPGGGPSAGAGRGRPRRRPPTKPNVANITPPNDKGLLWRIRNQGAKDDPQDELEKEDPLTSMISDYRKGKHGETSSKSSKPSNAAHSQENDEDGQAEVVPETGIDDAIDDGFLARYRKQEDVDESKAKFPKSSTFDVIGRVLSGRKTEANDSFNEAQVDGGGNGRETRQYIADTHSTESAVPNTEEAGSGEEEDSRIENGGEQTPFKALFQGQRTGEAKEAFLKGAEEADTAKDTHSQQKNGTAPVDLAVQSILASISEKATDEDQSIVLVDDGENLSTNQTTTRKKKPKKKNKALPSFLLSPAENGSTDCRACRGSGLCECRVCHEDGWIDPPAGAISEEMKMVWSRPDLVLDRTGAAQCPFCNGIGRNLCPDCQGSGSTVRKGFNEREEYTRVFQTYQEVAVDEQI